MHVLSVDVFSVHVPSERLLLMHVLSVDVFSVHVPSERLLLMNVLSCFRMCFQYMYLQKGCYECAIVFSVHVPSERLLLMNVLSVDVFSDAFSVHVQSVDVDDTI